jgi:hypothetical protein
MPLKTDGLVVVILFGLWLLLLALICASASWAHSWYPPACCSDADCVEVDSERVQEDAAGFSIDGGKYFSTHSATRQSPDGGYHMCPYNKTTRQLRCFFAPPRGV